MGDLEHIMSRKIGPQSTVQSSSYPEPKAYFPIEKDRGNGFQAQVIASASVDEAWL
jgi:hypothetical protein